MIPEAPSKLTKALGSAIVYIDEVNFSVVDLDVIRTDYNGEATPGWGRGHTQDKLDSKLNGIDNFSTVCVGKIQVAVYSW